MTSVLSACGSGGAQTDSGSNAVQTDSSSSGDAQTASPASETASADTASDSEEPASGLDPYNLVYYMYCTAPSDQATVVADAINKIIQPKFNATIEFVMITGGDWNDKAIPALRAGEKIDVFWTPEWMGYTKNIANESLLALDDPDGPYGDLINTYAPDTVTELGDFIPANRVNGFLYGVATHKELCVPSGWIWNKTLADKYNIDITKYTNVADLEPVLEEFKNTEEYANGAYPLLVTSMSATMLPQFVQGFLNEMSPITMYIGEPGARDGEPVLWYDTPEMKAYIELIGRYNKAGYIHPDANLTTFTNMDYLNAGNFLVSSDFVLKGGKVKANELMGQSGNPELVLDEFQNGPNVNVTTHAGGSMLGIPITSEDPARAMMFINEMHQNPELLNLMAWGVPGVHYDLVDGFAEPKPKNGWSDSHGGMWTLGDQFKQLLAVGEDPDKYKQMQDLTDQAFAHESLGFRFDRGQYDAEYTAIYNIIQTYERSFACGVNVESYDQFRAELDAAGLQKVFSAVKENYAAWKAEQ
jgi:putative aldouronate transport system substrate-binding protein